MQLTLTLLRNRNRSLDLEFFRRGTRTLNWRLSSRFLCLFNLQLFYSEGCWLVHGGLANWNVTFGCSLVEVAVAVRAGHICEHLTASVNINVLSCRFGPTFLFNFLLVLSTA